MLEHDHEWNPIPGWSGRYRCTVCLCFGYRGVVSQKSGLIREEDARKRYARTIIPYRCQKPGCAQPATVLREGQRCPAHR